MRVLKTSVPVDDQWHLLAPGPVLHVASQYRHDSVEVWTLEVAEPTLEARVFGTGHVVPDGVLYAGTALTLEGALVWHVFLREVA